MQKLINVLAVFSFGVSAAVVGGGIYLFSQQDQIKARVTAQVTDAIKEAIGTSELGSVLLGGVSDDVDVTDEALGANNPVELPVSPF